MMQATVLSAILVASVSVLPRSAFAQDQYFDAGGVRLRYVDQGTGAPIVLVHGYSSSIERGLVETGVIANLAKNYHVIAFDMRGHGKSGKPHDPKAYGHELVEVVRGGEPGLERRPVDRANLPVHQDGHPERLRDLPYGAGFAAERARLAISPDPEDQLSARLLQNTYLDLTNHAPNPVDSMAGGISRETLKRLNDILQNRNGQDNPLSLLRAVRLQSLVSSTM